MHLNEVIRMKSYERLIAVVRRHPITFVPTIALYAVLGFMPFAVHFVIKETTPIVLTHPFVYPLVVMATTMYYLAIIIFFLASFVDYYLDTLIITNDRLIDVDQYGLFGRTVSELDLYKVQDVTSEVKGFFASMFNFGNVYVQTAGAIERFKFDGVHNPVRVRQMIIDLAEKDKPYH